MDIQKTPPTQLKQKNKVPNGQIIRYEQNRDVFINMLSFLDLKSLFACVFVSQHFLPFLWEKDGVITRTLKGRLGELQALDSKDSLRKYFINQYCLRIPDMKLLTKEIVFEFVLNLSNRKTSDLTIFPCNEKGIVKFPWENGLFDIINTGISCFPRVREKCKFISKLSIMSAKINKLEFTQSVLTFTKLGAKEKSLFYFFLACKCAEFNLLNEAQEYANLAGNLKSNTYYKMAVILHQKGNSSNVELFIKNTGRFEQRAIERILRPISSKTDPFLPKLHYEILY
ncbi:MAG: hypothetical protein COZ46_06430 [Verrucomicrobia bacterium CG_4_10_14_3_um_filter_43_23]|nr:MAG: hypothetical protein AUJ82_00355 [Verrucomicrobia bacterium CG1_02_43_26]PIP59274.1 MAG: hypothetical protein COX01_04580 [Verrucomicrobia bacterium CG22_combo_CG10-13_8_21_14_all_43_17]PIX57930.1 MAG: hypothetical protein COZ46_06430 [Verrucomicrobia bacterium CG_4_10_14_3_um_filter_43_23]PIY61734.1 MAG: hypothetical protein COY94_03935 [Verrucomicrobia bacterium CG_4_10_14_0_8_um_filter_43_34]PJA43437.1 MAG: hypothetical protein CO175_08025 [Verrucomicrobia bacterium CG_4_9_14_3_um_fi